MRETPQLTETEMNRKIRMPRRFLWMILLLLPAFSLSARKKQRMPDYLTTSPFPWKSYQNSARYYRCVGYIKTTDVAAAHDKALLDAKTRLSKAILNSFNDNAEPGKNELLQIPLPDLKIISERTAPSGAHLDLYWLLIRVPKKNIRKKVQREYMARHKKDAKPYKFISKFDDEMESLKNYDY